MHSIIHLAIEHPKLAGAIGLGVAILFGILGVLSVLDMASLPEQAEVLSLTEISSRLVQQDKVWATVNEPVGWDCSNISQHQVGSSKQTDIPFSNTAQTIVAVATFNKPLTCEEIQKQLPSGFFYKASARYLDNLKEQGLDFSRYPSEAVYLDLCTICSRGNSLGLVAVFGIAVPVGLALYPLALWNKRQEMKKRKATT